MLVMIDNYDSFVYNLVMYLEESNEEVKIFRNDKVTIEEIRSIKPKGIVISPGPKAPKDVQMISEIIHEFKGEIPILGVCLGHQCIGEAFGGNVVKGKQPIHGKVSVVKNNGQGIFNGLPEKFKVTRYHSLVVDRESLPKELSVDCITEDGVIMGMSHKKYKIYGVQYHPEAVLTEQGHEILNKFLEICEEQKL